MADIIIVESPSKSHTIEHYLNGKYKVLSSKGHICDLGKTGKGGLGIDIENGFIPNYIILKDKEKLVESLKKECKGKNVYLATDPDREGEAIAYHLARVLNLDFDKLNRISFHEITARGVEEGLKNPTKIDLKMVDSQETRRMIDRILGFKLSKLLQKKINSKSAGRVQSAALLMIVNLEKQILAFVSENYYEMEAIVNGYKAKLIEINGKTIDSKNRITDRKVLENLKSRLLSFRVTNIDTKQVFKNSSPTFTTSTMQQDASNKLGFTSTKTMSVAQKLYEGINIDGTPTGLITYMRTDSTRLAPDFVNACKDYIHTNYGIRYVGDVKFKSQKNMQDAHEGIRPTNIERTPDSIKKYLTDDEYKLYSLIYKRTLASLMAAAVYDVCEVLFSNVDSVWQSTGKKLTFDGYLKVYGKSDEDKDENINFKLGELYNPMDVEILDKKTMPPARYTEATLIKDMEEKGIGRPSTYATTIKTLKDRDYINIEKRFIVPTEQGILTTDKLEEYFSSIINVKYTADMESDLDEIAEGNKTKTAELEEFCDKFIPLFDEANSKMEATYPIMTDEICPKCGAHLVIRLSKFGEFMGCSNYPTCDYIKETEKEDDYEPIDCPKCDGKIVKKYIKSGRKKGKVFFGCTNYPTCDCAFNDEPTTIEPKKENSIVLKKADGSTYELSLEKEEQPELEETNIICPKCGKGHLVQKMATKGKNKGNIFYACSTFPKCRATYSELPDLNQAEPENSLVCDKCGKGTFEMKVASKGPNAGKPFYACSNFPRCKNIISIEEYNKRLEKTLK